MSRFSRPRSLFLLSVFAVALLASACGLDPLSAPTLTPNPDVGLTAVALFPTSPPTPTATPTPLPVSDDSELIEQLLQNMELAVQLNFRDEYLENIDLSDPVFATEHERFATDWWLNANVRRFALAVRNLVIDGDTATADLNFNWALSDPEFSAGADYPVIFRKHDEGRWLYAGEQWTTFDEAEHFVLHIAPGLEALSEEILPMLPEVYAHVTQSLDRVPEGIQEIKIYDNVWAMIATIRLSLTTPIAGWNEPGESLKLLALGEGDDRFAPQQSTFAHEYAHFVTFAIGEDARDRIPWWLAEGISEYVASEFWTETRRNQRLLAVKGWAAEDALVAWDRISDFEETPEDLWQFVYPQGYAFVRFVTETYGQAARNTWLERTGTDLTLSDATREVLGLTFRELDAAFREWLAAA